MILTYNIRAMTTAPVYPHIDKRGDEPARLTRVPRILVSQIVADYLAHGWSPEEMCRQHPYLTLAEAHTAMAYYFDHQAEIDRDLEDALQRSEKYRRSAAPSKGLVRA